MREIIFHNEGKSIQRVKLCDPCYDIVSNRREDELCDACMKACTDAGMPMRPKIGTCAWCEKHDVLIGEFDAHPMFKFCGACVWPKTLKLRWKKGLCTGCFREVRVQPGYALGDKLFCLCKRCFNRYRPAK